jgi:anaerobic selenocysteine-containing dehydrogenase
VRPGTDAALLAWLARELLENGADEAELATACDRADTTRLRAALAPFELQRVARLTGIPSDELIDLLRTVQTRRRIAVAVGTGLSFGPHGLVAAWGPTAGTARRPPGRSRSVGPKPWNSS